MARPYWSGQITISLVTFGVKLFVATEAKSEIRFHQISRSTGERVRQQRVLASAQEAQEQSPEEGDSSLRHSRQGRDSQRLRVHQRPVRPHRTLRVVPTFAFPSKHVMEVIQFVSASEIDPEYFEKPYFVVPENDTQAAAFAVVRKALQDSRKIAISKIAFGRPRARRRHHAYPGRLPRRHDGLHHALRPGTARPQGILRRHQEARSGRRLP